MSKVPLLTWALTSSPEDNCTLRERRWQDQATCRLRGIPTHYFFPGTGESVPYEVMAACNDCPVMNDCLEEELSYSAQDQFGYRGGTTARERKRMVARRNKAMRSTAA